MYYAILTYSRIETKKLVNLIVSKDTSRFYSNGKRRQTLEEIFKAEFGTENVSYDSATQSYKIYKIEKAIASSKDLLIWKFAMLDNSRKSFMEKFIPKENLEDK